MTDDNTTRARPAATGFLITLDARYCAEQAAQMIREAHEAAKPGHSGSVAALIQIAEAWRLLGESISEHSRMRPR